MDAIDLMPADMTPDRLPDEDDAMSLSAAVADAPRDVPEKTGFADDRADDAEPLPAGQASELDDDDDLDEDLEEEDELGYSPARAGAFPAIKEQTVQPLGMGSLLPEEAPVTGTVGHDDDADDADAVRPGKAKKRRWYIVHTYSGHENKVKVNLERRIESMNMGHKIFRVEVPQKTITKIKDGKRQEKEERLFPGYVLVEMLLDDDSWYVVRHTPGVTKFVGSEKKPIPAKDSEIKRILVRTTPTTVTKVEIDLKVGETIRIISGPFADFEGSVTEVQPGGKLKASVSIFGRETPVELVFNQVQKI